MKTKKQVIIKIKPFFTALSLEGTSEYGCGKRFMTQDSGSLHNANVQTSMYKF